MYKLQAQMINARFIITYNVFGFQMLASPNTKAKRGPTRNDLVWSKEKS